MKRRLVPIAVLTLAIALGGTNSQAADPSDDAKRSVTVFPIVASPERFSDELAKRVGIVVATLLERAGVEDLEVADTAFVPPETDDVNRIADAFGKHVGGKAIKTKYAVFTQFVGTPRTGVNEIRTIVADRSGKVMLAESADKAQLDKALHSPKDPMTCCVFVARRLQEFWQLKDPLRPDAPQGKMAQFWQKDAGVPGKDELDAIAKRAATLKKNSKTSTCTVYPIHVGDQSNKQTAAELVVMLNESALCKTQVSETDPALKISGHGNEQKVLWDTARAFRDFVRKNPPATDYVAFADYGLFDTQVHHVHLIVCDRAGDWVLIEMQNSHHPDFQRIAPESAAHCNRLVVARLKDWLSD